MPWKSSDARRHNRKAVGKKGRQWSHVANAVLDRTGDEGRAIRSANSVIRKRGRKHRRGRKGRR